MTQVDLAKKMKVDQSAVSLWEAGKTKPMKKYRKRLAKILGCKEEDLTRSEN